jgi:WD40 repeat protein
MSIRKGDDDPLNWVTSMAFSLDGTRLAAHVDEEGVLLWDLRQPSATPLVVSRGEGRSVAFSPDGTRLAASDGKAIHIWDLWTRAADHLCTMVGHNLSMDEWSLNIGEGIPYQSTCPNLPPGAGAPGGK